MEPIIESKVTTIDLTHDIPRVEQKITRILSAKPVIGFTCRYCETEFETNNWYKTKGNNYGASCPCCSYSAWTRR